MKRIKQGCEVPSVYRPSRVVSRTADTLAGEPYVLEALEPRVLLTATPAAEVVPTPQDMILPFTVYTPRGLVVGLETTDGAGIYLTRFTDEGNIDYTFGTGGSIVARGVGELDDLAATPDGGVVAVTHDYQGGGVQVLRFDSDGQAEARFGDGGELMLPLRSLTECAVTVLADGRLIVAEPLPPEPLERPYGPSLAVGLYQYMVDGRPDLSFGGGTGFSRIELTNGIVYVSSVRATACGLSLLVTPWSAGGIDLIRADASGVGPIGKIASLGINNYPGASELADGSFVTLDYSYSEGLYVSRYTSDGDPDLLFGDQGVIKWGTDPDMWYTGPVIQMSDGTLVVTYEAARSGGYRLMALTATGETVLTFAGGAQTADVPRPGDDWREWDDTGNTLDAHGRILTASFMRQMVGDVPGDWMLGVSRFNGDGTIDATFGSNGAVFLRTAEMSGAEPMPTEVDGTVPTTSDVKDDLVEKDVSEVTGLFGTSNALPIGEGDAGVEILFGVISPDDLLGQKRTDLFAA